MLPRGRTRRCKALWQSAEFAGGIESRPVLAQAERGGGAFAREENLDHDPIQLKRITVWNSLELALWHAELPPIHVALASDRVARGDEMRIVLARQWLEASAPAFALHRQTLGDRSAFRQQSIETQVMPARREIGRGMVESVGIDQAGERREWQVGPVYGMGEQQRIAWRRLDGPKIIELDDETVVIEERRADQLTWIVKPGGRVRI